jgi:hypothetical protein
MHRSVVVTMVAALVLLVASVVTVAAAGHTPVDPATLSPEPPGGAVCWSTGTAVRCDSTFDASYANEPFLELACGTVYATATDIRWATRWYEQGLLVRRSVHETAEGFWTLSPTGAGPRATVVTHTGWGEDYLVPGDLSSAVGSQQGTDFLVRAPRGGVLFQVSGQTHGEERFTGRFLVPDDPSVAAALCEALTG